MKPISCLPFIKEALQARSCGVNRAIEHCWPTLRHMIRG